MRRPAALILFLAVFNAASAQQMQLRSSFQIGQVSGKGLENTASFAYDAYRERILVAHTGANAVEVFAAGGEFLFRVGETGGLSAPIDVAALSFGQLVILQEKSRVLKIYDEASQQLDTFNLAAVDSAGKFRFSRIVADGKDNLYFLDVGGGRILILDKDRKKTAAFGRAGRGKLLQPVALAVDQAGKIYAADEADCPLRVFDPKGRFLSCLEKNAPGKDGRWRPAGIWVDSKNRIWAIDRDAAALRVFDASGNLLQTIDSADEGMLKFFFPVQITVDRYGQLYLLEKGKNRIEVFQIENY